VQHAKHEKIDIGYCSGCVFFLIGSALAADLTDWHLRNSRLNAMAAGNGVYVAVGKNGFVMRSSDGISWSAVSSGVEDELGGVAYGNDLFFSSYNQAHPPAAAAAVAVVFSG
jgi:hypothetical protein